MTGDSRQVTVDSYEGSPPCCERHDGLLFFVCMSEWSACYLLVSSFQSPSTFTTLSVLALAEPSPYLMV